MVVGCFSLEGLQSGNSGSSHLDASLVVQLVELSYDICLPLMHEYNSGCIVTLGVSFLKGHILGERGVF